MHHTEVQALRRLLFMSIAEAARWIPADAERPRGVEDRTWSRWESGQRPMPENVADALRGLAAWRGGVLDEMRAQHMRLGAPLPLIVIWYDDVDDWPEPAQYWRPAQSVTAHLIAELPAGMVRLVAFDARAFRGWRLERGADDSAATRNEWAQWAALATPTAREVAGLTPPVLSSLDD